MSPSPAVNPFVPGRGHVPPFLAGREAEQAELKGLLAYLGAGRGSPRDVILSGPRGNGKTALLRWFQGEIEAQAAPIDTLWLTPADFLGLDGLATLLVPPRRFESLRPDTLSFSIGVGRLGWELGERPGSLTGLLTERCRQRPLVLLLDEAHTLPVETGKALLNASQSVGAAAPFLFAMAGTPGLHAHLNTMSATFWSRGRKLGIGLLDAEAAEAALTRPLAEMETPIGFEEGALRGVVEQSQGYPYFLQLWGAALWTRARDQGAVRIDASLVAQARAGFEAERAAYYEDRREELQRQGVLEVAARVAGAFVGKPALREHEINAVIAEALGHDAGAGDVQKIRDGLAALGYVWKAPGEEDRWRPGIPSLMGYVAAHPLA